MHKKPLATVLCLGPQGGGEADSASADSLAGFKKATSRQGRVGRDGQRGM